MKTVDFNVEYSNPKVTFTVETDDMDTLVSLYHRLNVGRNRLANSRKRIRDADGSFQSIGPRYADEYSVSKTQLAAKGTPLEDIADSIEDILIETGNLDPSNRRNR